MFAYLRGRLAVKRPALVVVDLAGAGYEVRISLATYHQLPEEGADILLVIQPCYREDGLTLYGFMTEAEKTLFNLLLSVTGVGPKMALTILSGTKTANFIQAVVSEDEKTLQIIPGVGKKMAKRLILELKDPLATFRKDSDSTASSLVQEAVGALVTLGYPRLKALQATTEAAGNPEAASDLEKLIKEALKRM